MNVIFEKVKNFCLIFILLCGTQVGLVAMQIAHHSVGFNFLSISTILVLMLGVVTVVLFIAKKEKLLTFEKPLFRWKSLLFVIGGYLSLYLASLPGAILLLLRGEVTTRNQERVFAATARMPLILMGVMVVISAPIIEEVVFRGIIPRILFKGKEIIGYILGSLLFGLIHGPTNIGSFLIYTGIGMVLAGVASLSKRLELSIMVHMLQNAIGFIYMVLKLGSI